MIWIIIAIIFIIGALVYSWSPRQALQEIPCKESDYKMLDIRDVLDYEAGHIPGAVNISLGRLPYVSNNNLSPTEPIVIVGKNDWKSKKAARILKKKGFRQIYVCMNPVVGCSCNN